MFSRNFTIVVNWILDNIIPPILRDSKVFMYMIMYPVYGKYTKLLFEFKNQYPSLELEDVNKYYDKIKDAPINLKRKTDLNSKCLSYVVEKCSSLGDRGLTILDAAAGRGLLAELLSKNHSVTAMDIVVPKEYKEVEWIKGNLLNIPFPDKSFDMVICTHAIEHIRDYRRAISELRRVAKRYVIIIMPCQREYKYTVDLHVNFCPYLYRFQEFIGEQSGEYFKLSGDWVCFIDKELDLEVDGEKVNGGKQ